MNDREKSNSADVRASGSPLSPDAWRRVAAALRLSDRERQIVQCLFEDMTEREAAARLSISSHTVHTHIARLYRKLGVRTRCGLASRIMTVHADDVSRPP